MIDLSVPQRQSPLAVVFLGIRTLRNIGIAQLVIIVVFVLQGPFDGPLLFIPALAILVFGLVSAMAWWRYTFQLLDGELVVRKGIVRDDRLTVPVERIQSLTIEQELLHRLTGLVKVEVDTAGSSEAEFTIDAIPRPVAEELERRAVTAAPQSRRPDDDLVADDLAAAGAEREVFRHDANRLLTAAVTASPWTGFVVLGPLAAALGQFGDELPFDPSDVATDRLSWQWIPLGVVLALAFSILLNLGRVFRQDWDLTLRASPSSLRRTSGLLSRTSSASSISRVQVLTTSQNPLQRQAGLREVELSTVGESDLWLVGCDDAQVDDIRAALDTVPERRLPLDRRIHRAEIWLVTRNTAVLTFLFGVALRVLVDTWLGFLALLAVPWVWWTRRLHVRNFRWSLDTELAVSERVFSSSTEQAVLRKANSVRVTQTFFERRRGLASVSLATAAGTVRVGMIPRAEAEAVRDVILHAAETDRRAWM